MKLLLDSVELDVETMAMFNVHVVLVTYTAPM